MVSKQLKVLVIIVAAISSAVTVNVAQAAVSPAPADVIGELSTKATAQDALPASFPLFGRGAGTVTLGAERLLASEGDFRYWATSNSEGKICLVALAADGSGGVNCLLPEDAKTIGLALRTSTPAGATEAYLVPDETASTQIPNGLKLIGDGLLIADPDAERTSDFFEVGELQIRDL